MYKSLMPDSNQFITIPKSPLFDLFLAVQIKVSSETKAELLQLKPHPFISTRNFINKKVGN